MPHYAIVIDDPDRELQTTRERWVEANMARTDEKFRPLVERRVAEKTRKRPAGTLHTIAAVECPVGMPNCRNCGDPAHAEECAAAGHCPQCGTAHGIAPTATVANNGYVLVEIPVEVVPHLGRLGRPDNPWKWDMTQRTFVPNVGN